ncbi:activating transcription factor 7-interacting protein 2 isoform X2 [Paralichthys olivaceus]|uniref:activating transcription factor 7-interacting protein 2 isoform X2 n=1 Tax=Paralichthys olivaceus TaxID=8255 RepID=UPI003753ABCA
MKFVQFYDSLIICGNGAFILKGSDRRNSKESEDAAQKTRTDNTGEKMAEASPRDTEDHSTKAKKCSPASERQRRESRARVNIGNALERWRDVKAAKGFKSDRELALCLLDKVKKSPSTSTSSGASDKTLQFSLSEVKNLIQQEVRSEVKRNENKLQDLIETVQDLDQAVDYERTIQKLEARINTLTKRAEAALVHMTKTQNKSPQQPPGNMDVVRMDSGNETMETMSQNEKDFAEFFHEMKTTEKALKKMHADNEDIKAAMATSSAVTANESPKCKENVKFIKKWPEAEEQKEKKTNWPKKNKEPKTEKEQCLSSNNSKTPKDSDQDKPSYPPLPPTPVPSTLNMEAGSYNIPQRLDVHLALIREPPGLSVLWKVEEEDPCAAPVESYSVYMAVEKVKGSSFFPKWIMLGELKAIQLPMCVMIRKYKPGHKVCVAVVGKDTFGRYGSYSEVVTAAIPE